ncbi:hypothetical protein RHGRI_026304 [Rhododendron griersonianum]|uniref:Uncharacterized protein n=1 Tax=Rhododendron griersonianum TaxID=479676 RepID=A0AAV6ISC7_9ERIC|nr:hypothetical protein RHGRI_026304 [Rhododendron griersonianum]
MFGSNSSTKKKSSKLVKSKTGSGNGDGDYEQDEGEEGMSSSDEGGVSSRLQGNKVCRAPRKKGCYTAHISRDSEPCWTNTSIPIGETQVVHKELVLLHFVLEFWMLVLYLAMGVRLFRLGCCQVVQVVVLSQSLEGSNMWEAIPRKLCGILSLG